MRTRSKVLIAVGAALAVLAGLWALIAPGQLVKYPSHLNKTVVATGTFSLSVNPSTGAPLAQPQVLSLSIHRHVHVVSSTGSQAVVKEDDLEKIGTLPQQDLQQQYVLDRSSLKNVASTASYAYAPANHVNRSPDYSISLPFSTGAGPYQIWKNEVGRSYTFRQQGATVSRDGLTLIPLQGQMTDVPAQSYYLAQLSTLGHLPTEVTLGQLTPQLKAIGIDPTVLSSTVLPRLSPSDRATITAVLTHPIPLRYVVSVKTRLLVEPTTGAIVSLDRIDQSLGAQPQLAGLTTVAAVLGKSAYRTNPVIIATRDALVKLAQSAPTSTVFSYTYGQTPASVADIASYANSAANKIDAVETTIPLVLLLVGVLSAVTGLILWRRERSGERAAGGGGPTTPQPAAADATPRSAGPRGTIPRTRDHDERTQQPTAPRGPQGS